MPGAFVLFGKFSDDMRRFVTRSPANLSGACMSPENLVAACVAVLGEALV